MRLSVSFLNLPLRCGRQEATVLDSIGLEASFFCYPISVCFSFIGNLKINLHKKMMQQAAVEHNHTEGSFLIFLLHK